MIDAIVFGELDLPPVGPHDLDACVAEDRSNAFCLRSWSAQDRAELQDWDGHNCWCNPPFSMILAILRRFLFCKRRSPHGTAATFVIPEWEEQSFFLLVTSLPKVFKLLRRFERGTALFTAPALRGGGRTYWGETRWPVRVYRVGPAPVTWEPSALTAC